MQRRRCGVLACIAVPEAQIEHARHRVALSRSTEFVERRDRFLEVLEHLRARVVVVEVALVELRTRRHRHGLSSHPSSPRDQVVQPWWAGPPWWHGGVEERVAGDERDEEEGGEDAAASDGGGHDEPWGRGASTARMSA
ncbi:MAG: hypothetical protein R3F34_18750 [Planctomycetota bacterium]